MGAQISSNRINTTQKIDDLLLELSIHGHLQSDVCNKQIAVTIDGFLMENDLEVKPSEETIKVFKDYVSTAEFKDYLQNYLLARITGPLPGFSYEIPAKTLQQLSWVVESMPELMYKNEQFSVSFKLFMKDEKKAEHKMSRAVAFVGKGIVAALHEKRSQTVPPLEPKSFAPTRVTFST